MIQNVVKKVGGQEFIVETGKMARQADGAVTMQLGGTMVLATCVSSKEVREGIDFLPLMVEYQEKTYAAGKIPGGFFKREGKPSEKEVLTARLIDRPIRPLFPKGMVNDIQVVALVLSSDGENDSDILALNAASCALSMSNIPFNGPIGCVRVGMKEDGEFILNPTFGQLQASRLDLVVAGSKDKVIMMEAACKEINEDDAEKAIEFAKGYIEELISMQGELVKKCKPVKRTDITIRKPEESLLNEVRKFSKEKLSEINKLASKEERTESIALLTKEIILKFESDENKIGATEIKNAIDVIEKELVRDSIAKGDKRIDGRSKGEIRPIECSVGILPRTHGSGLFTRGQTQALCVTTLGTSSDEQRIDALEGETQKSFMLHYNFPAFSVGEVKPFRGPGRREIGHGALAERALAPVMPSKDKFPYTIRIVSDILESDGSSSMATVCAGSLSLMDAGVPAESAVAGIAIGLVKENEKYTLLTDIAGLEDHYGDMDFKVAGTKKGITAIQLDLKIDGIPMDVLKEAFLLSKKARLEVLDKMTQAIASPKESISSYAPRIVNLKISPDKIKDIIGPGGRMIKKIIKDTGVTIDVEDTGDVQVASNDAEAMERALEIIKGLSAEVEPGQIYEGTITRLMNFGAFCEILPGKEGLIHVSEIANRFVKDVASEVKVGDNVKVKVIEIDQQGRINLSIKQASPDYVEPPEGEKREKHHERDHYKGNKKTRR